jgi:N-acetylmuramoyl-L-alanine amidase
VAEPRLTLGSRGRSVLVLEQRLAELRYALPRVDADYGLDTYQAVLAFQKVQGLPQTGRVDERVWAALRRAATPRPRYGGTHIEVSKGRQLLYVVRNGRVESIVHVSTGATGNTPLGTWRIYRKTPGWDWVLWYPMYFLRGFAIHGYPDVPPYPASHGCVRVPMWIAPQLYSRFTHGQLVRIYW